MNEKRCMLRRRRAIIWTQTAMKRDHSEERRVDNLFLCFISPPRRVILFLMEIYLTAGYDLSETIVWGKNLV
jgi:hypothetical protein